MSYQPPPGGVPLGLLVARSAKALDRAFDDVLVAAGGNRPSWLVLLAVMSGAARTQSELAERVGVSGPTLTHHLDRMEAAGLVRRNRDPRNRRAQSIELTDHGRTQFFRLRDAAVAFDRRLHTGLDDAAVDALRDGLQRLADNVRQSS